MMWKGNVNTITLLFSLKVVEILHKERRGQVKIIIMEPFNGILFHKYRHLSSSIPITHLSYVIRILIVHLVCLIPAIWYVCIDSLMSLRGFIVGSNLVS